MGSSPITLPWGYRGWADGQLEFHPTQFSVFVTGRPILLTGRLSGATVANVATRPEPPVK